MSSRRDRTRPSSLPSGTDVRVALFLPSLGGGGAERVMVNLARGFAARGLDVDLVLVRAEGPYLADVPDAVRVIRLNGSRVILSLPALVRYLRRERPAVLLSTLNTANVIAACAGWLAGTGTKTFVRQAVPLSHEDGPRAWVTSWLIRYSYPLAASVIAVSEGVRLDLSKEIGLSLDRIRVVPNPVVTPDLLVKAAEPIDHPWFAPGAPPVILGVGRLSGEKDFPTLVRAFADLRRRRELRLMILGEGAQRPRLERLVRDLGIEDDVALPGFVANPFSYIKRASLVVLSSTYEGMPAVLIQALACGTPVVSTDCDSGPREILENGRLGVLVPVGDSIALAEAMARTLDVPPTSLPPGALGRYTDGAAVDAYLRALEV